MGDNFVTSHNEVQVIVRSFFTARGYKIVTNQYLKHNRRADGLDLPNRYIPDDVFLNEQTGWKFLCEYKPEVVKRIIIWEGIGQCLTASAELGLPSYLVLGECSFIQNLAAIVNAPWLGIIVYEDGCIKHWRRPVSLLVLPTSNNINEIRYTKQDTKVTKIEKVK